MYYILTSERVTRPIILHTFTYQIPKKVYCYLLLYGGTQQIVNVNLKMLIIYEPGIRLVNSVICYELLFGYLNSLGRT